MNAPRPPPGDLSPEARALYERLLQERGKGPPERPPTPGREGPPSPPQDHPLSPTQRRLWSLGSLMSGTAWGNLPLAFGIEGPLRADALRAALRDVTSRHDILRTTYRETSEGVCARVWPPGEPDFRVVDAREAGSAKGAADGAADSGVPPSAADSGVPPSASDSGVPSSAAEVAREPFDLEAEPPFRARWVRTGPDRGTLVIVTHHLVTDGWSIGLLLDELGRAYASRLEGEPPAWEPLSLQYGALAASERSARTPDAALDYWLSRLEGAPPELPLRTRGQEAGEFESGKVSEALEPRPSEALRALAARAGVTPFGAWLALYQVVLGLRSGIRDVVVGTTVSRRDQPARERLIGNFGNNLLLRVDLRGEPTFRDLLARTAETLPRDLAHQEATLEALLGRTRGSGSRLPRFHVLFMLRDGAPEDRLRLPGCAVRYVGLDAGVSPLDLALDVWDLAENGFRLTLEHRRSRVSDAEAADLLDSLRAAGEAVTADPDLPVADLPVPRPADDRTDSEGSRPDPGPPPVPAEAASARAGPPPTTEAERMLARLWADALGVEPVGTLDNFFELGGHSLLAISLLETVEEETGRRLTPMDLASQTLGQLAAALERDRETGEEEAGPSGRRASRRSRLPRWLGGGGEGA